MAEIKKKYEEFRKKYNLPEYKEINREFEISTIEKDDFLLVEVRKKMDEKIELFIKIIDRVLQPDTYLADMREQRMFNDTEKKDIFEVYKDIQVMHKQALLLLIAEDEKKNAEYINTVWKSWKKIKEAMIKTVEKMRDSWKEDISFDQETNYLG